VAVVTARGGNRLQAEDKKRAGKQCFPALFISDLTEDQGQEL